MRVRLLSIGNYRIDICFACCVWNSRTRGSCAAKFTVITFHYWRCKKWLLCRHEGLVDKLLRIVRAILSQLRERFIQLLKEGWNWKINLLTNWTGHTISFLVKFCENTSPSICERCKRIFFISESLMNETGIKNRILLYVMLGYVYFCTSTRVLHVHVWTCI